MTQFYLTYRQVVPHPTYKEDIFVRDGSISVGAIVLGPITGRYHCYIKNKGSTVHNNIHQARDKAQAVLSKVYESSPCIND